MTTELHIKNMVCPRCISSVQRILTGAGYQPTEVTLGHAVLAEHTPADPEQVRPLLEAEGFELLLTRDEQLVAQLKTALADYLNHLRTARTPLTTSAYLADRFGTSYAHLSKLFSREAGITLEKYLIRLKIERVKELLSYGELTLADIAEQLRYSSSQHLSNQFRQVTGQTVTEYKAHPDRTALDQIA
ncbi:helix-turn-helix transcriptional regulator [Hymenobacter busanensis]|uniref:Helix-turn-helix transcriptional regulator n=1 Tax=Hymenobacter busanensis TaxID=2607656 RepID=A0A7L5A324_9BACT|nr:helix-turn-helix transcriptional regulator [Hymenobacter busanensis]KAA9338707.1 helix-turn-helix transcriptional regulator [Hymenobacter busanensis]QHJ08862.1 helix-turn-helix domain-containing protein [Hymenobacter busanensis]